MTGRRTVPLQTLSVGSGPPIVLLHGFAMQPRTYLPLARALAHRAHVVIPALCAVPGRWRFDHVLDSLQATLDDYGFERVSLLGHSFGGGIELGLAARDPGRVVECVFADTLGVRARFGLAAEALHRPLGLLAMATPAAASAFLESVVTHPVKLADAAMWAFGSDREPDIRRVVAARIPCHVLWANHDTLLARSDGQEFARRLRATFTVASGARMDHDWMFEHPTVFAEHLRRLALHALSSEGRT